MPELSFDEWMESAPTPVRERAFFKPLEDGTQRTEEQFLADVDGAANMIGNIADSHIKIPSADDVDALTVAQKKAMEKIPGLAKLPGEDDEEGMAALLGKLGRPEKAEDYSVSESKQEAAKSLNLEELKERAHQLGMTQRQFATFLDNVIEDQSGALDKQQNLVEENQTRLQEMWGEAFKERHSTVNTFLENDDTAPPALKEQFQSGVLSPEMVNWIYERAMEVGGEAGQTRKQAGGDSTLTPAEAEEQLNEIERRIHSMRRSDPEYDALIKKRMRLMRAAYPDADTDLSRLKA